MATEVKFSEDETQCSGKRGHTQFSENLAWKGGDSSLFIERRSRSNKGYVEDSK